MSIKLIDNRKDDGSGGWSRTIEVDGKRYQVAVRVKRRVQMRYKPRGQYGYVYEGLVYADDARCLLAQKVNGSIGARGLLKLAGVL